jgi:hypothetical protein
MTNQREEIAKQVRSRAVPEEPLNLLMHGEILDRLAFNASDGERSNAAFAAKR